MTVSLQEPSLPSQRFGEYEVIQRLGAGGMAEILLARWNRMGAQRIVVIKQVLPQFRHDPSFVEMLLDEVRVQAGLEHPNIVRIYDAGFEGGIPYLVMEFVDGVSLRTSLQESGPLSVAEWVGVGTELCRALQYAHSRPTPVIHRDVSPHNVLLSKSGFVKLGDFGIARAAGLNRSQTQTGVLKGKLAYLAPEQLEHGRSGPKSDQFSLGLTLYEAAVGDRAYSAPTDVDLIRCVAASEWDRGREAWQQLPAGMRAVVERMLAKEPEQRFPNLEAAAVALREVDPAEDWASALAERLVDLPSATNVGSYVLRWESQTGECSESSRIGGEYGWADETAEFPQGLPRKSRTSMMRRLIGPLVMLALVATIVGLVAAGRPFNTNNSGEMDVRIPAAGSIGDRQQSPVSSSPQQPSPPGPSHRGTVHPVPAPVGEADPEPGWLTVQVVPWGMVHIDGLNEGTTPLVRHKLAAGTHRIHLINEPLGWRRDVSVEIRPGEETEVRFHAHQEDIHDGVQQ